MFVHHYTNHAIMLHHLNHVSYLMQASSGKRLVTELTALYTHADDERKFNRDICELLIRARLLNMAELDAYLAKVGVDGQDSIDYHNGAHTLLCAVVHMKILAWS